MIPVHDPKVPLRMHLRPAQWRGIVARVLSRHGLSTADLEPATSGSDVVWLSSSAVIKISAPAWADEIDAEARWCEAAQVPTPQVLAVGREQDWPYVITQRLPGRGLDQVWAHADRAERLLWAARLGELVAALHATPVTPDPGWDAYVAESRRQAPERERAITDTAAFLADVRWTHAPHVLLHTELLGEHVLVDDDGVTGVIDLADGRVGHPLYEVAAPVQFLFKGEPGLLTAFFDAWGRERPDAETLLAWSLSHRFGRMARVLEQPVPACQAADVFRS
jgi:hygromycin-B 7''-O-kinase